MRLLIRSGSKEFTLEDVELNGNSLTGTGAFFAGSKVKTIGAVDLEHLGKVNDMVEFLLNGDGRENRVLQAIKSLRSDGNPMDSPKEIPLLIQWLRSDIASENMSDIQSSGLSSNDVMRAVLDKAKREFLELI